MELFKMFDLKKALTNNFWLKIASLAIAVLLWFYIIGTITGGGKST